MVGLGGVRWDGVRWAGLDRDGRGRWNGQGSKCWSQLPRAELFLKQAMEASTLLTPQLSGACASALIPLTAPILVSFLLTMCEAYVSLQVAKGRVMTCQACMIRGSAGTL